jgi:hypothetical protein
MIKIDRGTISLDASVPPVSGGMSRSDRVGIMDIRGF